MPGLMLVLLDVRIQSSQLTIASAAGLSLLGGKGESPYVRRI